MNCDACAQVNYVDVNGMRFSVGVSLSVREEGVAGRKGGMGQGLDSLERKGGLNGGKHARVHLTATCAAACFSNFRGLCWHFQQKQ